MAKRTIELHGYFDLSNAIFAFSQAVGESIADFEGYCEIEETDGAHHMTIEIVHVPHDPWICGNCEQDADPATHICLGPEQSRSPGAESGRLSHDPFATPLPPDPYVHKDAIPPF